MPSGKNGTPILQDGGIACLDALYFLAKKNTDHIAVINGDLLSSPQFSHVSFLYMCASVCVQIGVCFDFLDIWV